MDNTLYSYAGRLAIVSVLHPIDYFKTLMQIGFEPLPSKPSRTLLGKSVHVYPNVFVYASYIRSVSGTVGFYAGLTPRICGSVLSAACNGYIIDKFPIPGENEEEEKDGNVDKKRKRFVLTLGRDLFATSTAIIFSQPFHVIAVRMMAQFVGGETKYNGVVSSLVTIYKEEGIGGWFAGLVPRLFGEVAALFCISSIKFIIKNYVVTDDKNVQQFLSLGVDYFVKNIFYPYRVVEVCMAVNGCGLRAGSPPFMPNYSGSWINCWNDLGAINQRSRGNSLFWRYVPEPNFSSTSIPLPEIEVPKRK